MGGPQNLAQGSIVWAVAADARGQFKRRPLVVLTPTDLIKQDVPLTAVAVTTTYADPPPLECVELPWESRRHPMTQLKYRSAAVCTWVVELRIDAIEQVRGVVPPGKMLEIVERVKQFKLGGET